MKSVYCMEEVQPAKEEAVAPAAARGPGPRKTDEMMGFDVEPAADDEDVMTAPFSFTPIGYMQSPLRKNGSPRQGQLAGDVRGRLRVSSGTGNNEAHALEGLAGFTHVWLVFVFHRNRGAHLLRNKVQAPKVADKKGLFATRSPHRPNPIGLTLCRLDGIADDGVTLLLSQHDLIDGTPVLDVKVHACSTPCCALISFCPLR